jgi:hypothetical protein
MARVGPVEADRGSAGIVRCRSWSGANRREGPITGIVLPAPPAEKITMGYIRFWPFPRPRASAYRKPGTQDGAEFPPSHAVFPVRRLARAPSTEVVARERIVVDR